MKIIGHNIYNEASLLTTFTKALNLQVRYWDQKDHPITRFYHFLVSKGAWSETQEKEWKNESKKRVSHPR